MLSAEEEELLSIFEDPVKWAELFLKDPNNPTKPIKLRWYQKEILSGKTELKAVRMGRGTGKTVCLAIYALHRAFTVPNTKVLIVTPFESQIKIAFDDTIRPMLQDATELKGSIVKDRSQPFEITLSNNSRIMGMTAGTKSGQHGASIRGSNCNVLIMDEADYLSEKSFVAIRAMRQRQENVEMWVSSTPTGKRESFYQMCTDKRLGFAHFHFPSSVSPIWNPSLEKEARIGFAPEDYEHEFEAEWGSQVQGVFNPEYIDPSLRSYKYEDMSVHKLPRNVRILGVDWNAAKHGVQLIIIEFSTVPTEYPFRDESGDIVLETVKNKFTVINRIEIKEKVLTQHKAKTMIVNLLATYNIDHLYVDEGYGATSIEDLQIMAKEYPSLNIIEKLRAVNLASKITVFDPVSQLPVEKPIKPYMVGHAELRMEEGACILPEEEDNYSGIVGQMRNYVVVRYSDSGYPTYSTVNDHALDAWMIGMLGFAEEYSELKRVVYANNITTVKPERMAMYTGNPSRSQEYEDVVPRNRPRSEVIEKTINKLGLRDQSMYVGYDGNLSDDSDYAMERRKRVDRAQGREFFFRGPKRNRFDLPARSNITVSPRSRFPGSG